MPGARQDEAFEVLAAHGLAALTARVAVPVPATAGAGARTRPARWCSTSRSATCSGPGTRCAVADLPAARQPRLRRRRARRRRRRRPPRPRRGPGLRPRRGRGAPTSPWGTPQGGGPARTGRQLARRDHVRLPPGRQDCVQRPRVIELRQYIREEGRCVKAELLNE